MATVSRVGDLPYRIVGNQKVTVTDVTLDSSYPTGGEAVTASELGLNYVETADCQVKTVSGTVNIANAIYDETNDKIKVYDETPAEVANGASLASCVIRVRAYGH